MLCQHFRYRHRQRLHRQVQHRCVVGIFDSRAVAINKSKISLRYLSQFTRQKKEKEEEKKEAVQCRKPEPQRFN